MKPYSDAMRNTAICPIDRLLQLIGDRWSVLILRDLFNGIHRFDALQRDLAISRKVLSERLATLVSHEIVIRIPYQQRPERFEYRLSERGRELLPLLINMHQWGSRWLIDIDEQATTLIHRPCGHPLNGELRCRHCGEPITAARIKVRA